MIIKTISAENFGKFDRYSVSLDDNINVFYGSNEAGKSTLYQIISTLLFAPTTSEETLTSNKLIKKGEEYARVYAIMNIKGKEVSVAREIYQNDTNLTIAEKDNISSLGNVNVPFIGDLSRDMYENLHTIDYYNMATITNNVWEQIMKMIQQTHGAPRRTPLFTTDENEEDILINSPYAEEITALEKEISELYDKLKLSKQSQIKMIKNQETIDKFQSSLEDVEHNIELESAYLREADKMNNIRATIKKTQDLALELETYKKLEPYMPDLREKFMKLKEYSYRKENNLPTDDIIFDAASEDMELVESQEPVEPKIDVMPVVDSIIASEIETAIPADETKSAKEDISQKSYEQTISESSFANQEVIEAIKRIKHKGLVNNPSGKFNNNMKMNPYDVDASDKESTKQKNTQDEEKSFSSSQDVLKKSRDLRKMYGMSTPYSDSHPDMSDTDYSNVDVSGIKDDDKGGYSSFKNEEETEPTLSADANALDIRIIDANDDKSDSITDYDIIRMGDSLEQVDEEAIKIAIEKAKILSDEDEKSLHNSFTAFTRVVNRNLSQYDDIQDIIKTLEEIDISNINKSVVEYRELTRNLRKIEHNVNRMESSANNNSKVISMVIISFISMILGVGCFFIEQIVDYVPQLEVVSDIIMSLPFQNYFAGGAFALIGILLIVASILGSDSTYVEKIAVDEVEMDNLRNKLRSSKRQIIDSLKDLPVPPEYLDNPSNNIVQTVGEIKSAYEDYLNLQKKISTPESIDINLVNDLSNKFLSNKSDDVFENIKSLRELLETTKEKIREETSQDNQHSISPKSFGESTNTLNIPSNNEFSEYEVNSDAPNQQVNSVKPASASFGGPGSVKINSKIMSPDDSDSYQSELDYDDSIDEVTNFGAGINTGDGDYDQNDISYPTASDSSSNLTIDSEDNTYPNEDIKSDDTGENPYGIPGIRKYDGISDSTDSKDKASFLPDYDSTLSDNAFDTTKEDINHNPFEEFIQPEAENPTEEINQSEEDNPYGIPGIRKYGYEFTENDSETEDNLLDNDEIEHTDMTDEEDGDTLNNPYELLGIHKYNPDVDNSSDIVQNTDTELGSGISDESKSSEPLNTESSENSDFVYSYINSINEKLDETQEADNEEDIALESVAEDEPPVETEIEEDTDVNTDIDIDNSQINTAYAAETAEEIVPAEEIQPVIEKDEYQKEYDKLLELLGENPEATIDRIYELKENLEREVISRDKAMEEIIQHNDAAIRLSTLSSSKWPYKQKSIDDSRERIEDLHTERVKLKTQLDILMSKQYKFTYEETPQAISDEIRLIQEKISNLKIENDKYIIAHELLRKQGNEKVSTDYDKSHVIEDTSAYMKELTLGKYDMVKINEDQTGLSIRDKDGEWFDTAKVRLSQSTREQLYLSLRISIADYFDEKSLIFPMFFDEALITWDKKRMHAVMRLLSKMSAHRQVLIFTCHDWLKDMIKDYLIGAKIIMM